MLTGASATIVVRIFGPDLTELRRKAQEVGKALSAVDGVADLKVQQQTLVPQVEVRLRPEAAQTAGLTPARFGRRSPTLVQGTKVGEIYEEQKIFDVVVWGVPQVRADLFAIKRLPIDTAGGGYVPLEDVADVTLAPTPNEIKREGASRRIDVTCNVQGRDLGASRARSRQRSPACRFRTATTPSSSASTPRAKPRRTAFSRSACCRWSASCCCSTPTSARRGSSRSWR